MSHPSPFEDEDYLCHIEANDPGHDISICLSIPHTNVLFNQVSSALETNTKICKLWIIAPKKSEVNVDMVGWVHFLKLIGGNRSITSFSITPPQQRGQFQSTPQEFFVMFLKEMMCLKTSSSHIFIVVRWKRLQMNWQVARLLSEIFQSVKQTLGMMTQRPLPSTLNQQMMLVSGIHALQLSLSYFGEQGIQCFARALARSDFPLQYLLLQSNAPDPSLADVAVSILSNPDSKPNGIVLSGVHNSEAGGNAFGNILVTCRTPLEYLEVYVAEDYHAGVVGIMALLIILSNDPSKTPKNMCFQEVLEGFSMILWSISKPSGEISRACRSSFKFPTLD